MRLQGLKNKTRFWSDLVGSVHYSDGYESFVSRSIWQPVESQPWKEYAVPSEIFVESLAWDLSQDLLVIWGGRMDRMGFLVAEAAIHLVSLSTGKPHPRATKPWFDLEGVPEEHVDLLILGDILVHRFPDEDQGGALSVWNWKSGVLLEARAMQVWAVAFISSGTLIYIVGNTADEQDVAVDYHLALRKITEYSTLSPVIQEIRFDISLSSDEYVGSIGFTAPILEVDSFSIPNDLPMSPYIWDEDVESMICIKFYGTSFTYFIRPRALCRQFEAGAGQHTSMTYNSQEDSLQDIILRVLTNEF
ncbi:hypothetical protein PIIN_09462 [Serendipita indica DSM 11827]|uniref:Uncharacterized protein n=1 Tax=Serendipita indica (strain DSM 11827) TaxID=1109443 RepID=G4TVY6_SERID|nr:hypothetical protein PIIN_09462 [Serendipita indica DSM 11827]